MLLSLWWMLSLVFFGLGTILVRWRGGKIPAVHAPPGVSVLKPLKGLDQELAENLESFFLLDYPHYELIFSVADPSDPARVVVECLQKRYPQVLSRLVLGLEGSVINPKVNNLLRPYRLASHDLILISDSNVRVSPSYLKRMVAQMRANTGVLTAVVAGVGERGWGGLLEATYLNTFYARGLPLAFFFGRPCVIGKSMMFRKSAAERFGGMRFLGAYLAEDYMMGVKMRELGLKVGLAADPVRQFVGDNSFASFWARHLRWGRIRKAHAPLAFFAEPLFAPLLASLGGGLFLHRMLGCALLPAALSHLAAFGFLDYLVAAKVREGQTIPRFLLGWACRELLAIPMWVAVAAGNKVQWRGRELRLQLGGKIREEEVACIQVPVFPRHFSGEPQPQRTRLKGTTNIATGGNGRVKAILPEG